MWDALHLQSRKLGIYAILSLADLALTWRLVHQGAGVVYESNPVANAWLSRYGWLGLMVFKALMVVSISVLAVLIAKYRPRASSHILAFACLVTGTVVLYSCYLTRLVGGEFEELRLRPLPRQAIFRQIGDGVRKVSGRGDIGPGLGADWLPACTALHGAAKKPIDQDLRGGWLPTDLDAPADLSGYTHTALYPPDLAQRATAGRPSPPAVISD